MAAFYPTSRANEAAEAARTGLDELNAEAEAELTGSASDAVCGVGGIKDTDDRRPDSSSSPYMSSSTFGPDYAHNVMFLCNHNSCRSQMADGLLRSLRGEGPSGSSVGVASAGIVGGTAVNPGAITVMSEIGLDISAYSSDAMADFKPDCERRRYLFTHSSSSVMINLTQSLIPLHTAFDVVISCCGCGDKLTGDGKDSWKKRAVFEDWNLDDPPTTDPGDLSEYRRVRDEIKVKVEQLLKFLGEQ